MVMFSRSAILACVAFPVVMACAQPGPVVGWGDNFSGQSSPPSGSFLQVAGGLDHSVGIRADGTIATWGVITDVPSGLFKFVDANDGHQPFCVGIRTDGTLASWGVPVMGAINLPLGSFMSLALGDNHGIGIRDDGTLVGWGRNDDGQASPPSGTFIAVAASGLFSFGVRTDGTLAAWGNPAFGVLNVPSGTFTAVGAGQQAGLALRTDGSLATWGAGFLTMGVPSGSFTDIGIGAATGYALRTDGTLAGWGFNQSGQANVPPGTYRDVAGGWAHGLAIVPAPASALLVAAGMLISRRKRS